MPHSFRFGATRYLLFAACVFCMLWGMASLSFPFGWDQGIMASVGDVVLGGGMPYRDAWDIKGPLAHLWFAAAQWAFGRGQFGIRALDVVLLTWGAIALGRATARLTRPSAGPWAAVGLVLCHASLTFFHTAQPDGAVSLCLVLSLTPLMLGARARQVIVAGLVIGLAALVKPPYLIFLALPLMVTMRMPRASPRRRAGYAIAVVGAAGVPILITLGWFVERGALKDLIEVLFRYNALEYSDAGRLALRARTTGVARFLWSGAAGPALAFVIFGASVAWRRAPSAAIVIVGWLLAGFALVGLQGKFFVYHWTVVYPPAILLVAVAIDALIGRSNEPLKGNHLRMEALGYAAAVAIIAPLAVQPASDIADWLRFAAGLDTKPQYYATFREGDFSAADQMAAADYIRTHTVVSDRVAILGYATPALYLSGRRNATRFGYALPLLGTRSSLPVREAYRREFLNALSPPPEYIVVGLLLFGSSRSAEVFPEFFDYLNHGYVLEQSFGALDIYHRVQRTGSVTPVDRDRVGSFLQ